ncbi:hypothetical protein BKI51_23690 (plasmid) [Alphaproteobacteria bacterium AO1-B]|nr:hypothetical protein BKI51_23690 [Alphaproteobacteria bacterium AO1-B]
MSLAFDASFYQTTRPDVYNAFIATGGSTGLTWAAFAESHYDTFGRFEGSDPNAQFDTSYYLEQNTDVAAAGVNPFTHFLGFGATEGRFPTQEVATSGFSEATYLAANSDVQAAVTAGTFASGYQHWILFGQFETRDGAPTLEGSSSGSTFTLTTDVDVITGTAGNDTINGVNGSVDTFTVVDSIDGGTGTDSFNLLLDDASSVTAFPAATVTNVEQFFFRDIDPANTNGFTFDASLVEGETQLWADRSTDTNGMAFTNVASGTTIGVKGDGNVTNAAVTATYGAAVTTGALAVDGGTTAGAIAVNGTAATLTTLNITSTGAANTLGGISTTGQASVAIDATTSLVTGGITVATNASAQSLTVSGVATNIAATATAAANGAVVIGTLDTDFATVDASGLTNGGIAATISAVTQTITGGAGTDLITTGGVLTTGSVDAGAGTDTLTVAASADLATSTLGAKYTNFEVLAVNDAQSVDLDNITGITAIVLNDAGGNTTVSDLSATQAGAITMTDTNGAVTIGVKDATNVGQIDTVSITVDDGDTTGSEAGTAAALPTILGVENLNIIAVDDAAFTLAAAQAPNLSAVTLTGSGDHTFLTGNMSTANFSLDASGSTGTNTLDASGFATNGVSVTGGSGVDTISGSGQNDILSGGAGADIIDGNVGLDVMTGGEAADRFDFAAGDVGGVVSATNLKTITDFNTGGSDVIRWDANLSVVQNGTAAVGNAAIDAEGVATFAAADDTVAEQLTAVEAAIVATGNADGAIAFWTNGSDSYVFISDGTDGLDANDMFIKLTGVTGLTDSTISTTDLTLA